MHNEYIYLTVTDRISGGKSSTVQHQRSYRSSRYLHFTALNYSLNLSKMFDSTVFDRIIRLITRYRKLHAEFHIQIGISKLFSFKRGHKVREFLCLALRNHREACLDLTWALSSFKQCSDIYYHIYGG